VLHATIATLAGKGETTKKINIGLFVLFSRALQFVYFSFIFYVFLFQYFLSYQKVFKVIQPSFFSLKA
jgi:hypothetical protein